jgi:pyridoxamine 5'-phosphate oxidase
MTIRPDSPHDVHLDHPFDERHLSPDPISQFTKWFERAERDGMKHPEGFSLSTVDANGRPSSRIVLMKEYDARGFVFYTNYESRKSRELVANPNAAMTFWWESLERQVRIEGRAEKVSAAESDDYYSTRPRGSQIGAWASEQSAVISTREVLEEEIRALEAKFGEGDIARPTFWGGWRIVPEVVEFWQGRKSRLHDRLRYRREGEGWVVERLSP